ncbi:MAG: translation initiation factor IF-2 [bacterium]|nr:translation initiation factor IF-2 [bacterium]
MAELTSRSPIVAVMGHVDHGKTTLLDFIRKTNVASREHGGITQHLGAYQVKTDSGAMITFLDTPGHAAFEGIRKRGGEVADIVILVVAANDGVMPQTQEAIKHIKNSGCAMIVAINKIDLEDSNIDHVKQQLAENEVLLESYGGDVVSVEISAKTGKGVPELLDMIGLVSDILELKTDLESSVVVVCLESRTDKAGPVASLLVKQGILKAGTDISFGGESGRIRAMKNDKGELVKSANPSQAVEVIGLPKLPQAGDAFIEENGVLVNDNAAGALALRNVALLAENVYGDIFSRVSQDMLFPIIVKADAAGSLEALLANLPRKSDIKIIDNGIGEVGEAEVMKARGTRTKIYAFNVGVGNATKRLAQEEKVVIKDFKIIYKLFEELERDIDEYFTKAPTESISGKATILKIFDATAGGKIAGVKVSEGVISVGGLVRILRNGEEIAKSKVMNAKKLREDVPRVSSGQEGGITFEDQIEFEVDDVIEHYKPLAK